MITGPSFTFPEHPGIKPLIEAWAKYVFEDPVKTPRCAATGVKPILPFNVPNVSKKKDTK